MPANTEYDLEQMMLQNALTGSAEWAQAYATLQSAKAQNRLADQVKWLGTGDAATTMGALEFVGIALEKIATAIGNRDPEE